MRENSFPAPPCNPPSAAIELLQGQSEKNESYRRKALRVSDPHVLLVLIFRATSDLRTAFVTFGG